LLEFALPAWLVPPASAERLPQPMCWPGHQQQTYSLNSLLTRPGEQMAAAQTLQPAQEPPQA
jgi:hypothetical protein